MEGSTYTCTKGRMVSLSVVFGVSQRIVGGPWYRIRRVPVLLGFGECMYAGGQ